MYTGTDDGRKQREAFFQGLLARRSTIPRRSWGLQIIPYSFASAYTFRSSSPGRIRSFQNIYDTSIFSYFTAARSAPGRRGCRQRAWQNTLGAATSSGAAAKSGTNGAWACPARKKGVAPSAGGILLFAEKSGGIFWVSIQGLYRESSVGLSCSKEGRLSNEQGRLWYFELLPNRHYYLGQDMIPPYFHILQQPEVLQGGEDAVLIHRAGDIIRLALDIAAGVSHGHPDMGVAPVLPLRHILGREVYQAVAFFTREEELAAGPRFFPGLEAMETRCV